jgi:hypothetical protein
MSDPSPQRASVAPWHVLLALLPADAVVRRQPVSTPEVLASPAGAAIAGWEQITVELSAGASGLRHVLVVLDASGRPISAGDTVLYCNGPEIRQESLGGRLEDDGTFRGTRWRTVGVEEPGSEEDPQLLSTPSQPTPDEVEGVKALVAQVLRLATR